MLVRDDKSYPPTQHLPQPGPTVYNRVISVCTTQNDRHKTEKESNETRRRENALIMHDAPRADQLINARPLTPPLVLPQPRLALPYNNLILPQYALTNIPYDPQPTHLVLDRCGSFFEIGREE